MITLSIRSCWFPHTLFEAMSKNTFFSGLTITETTQPRMSWQQLLDELTVLPGCRLAVIASRDNGETLAKFENGLPSEISQYELQIISDLMGSYNLLYQFTMFGINIGGEKYDCTEASRKTVIGRNGNTILTIRATNKCIVAAAALDNDVTLTVEKVADLLVANNDYQQ